MKRLFCVAVLGATTLAAPGCSGSHRLSVPLQKRIAAMTGTEARSLGDSSVKMAQVYGPASYIALEEASTGQRVSKSANAPKGRFYLIVLHGHFVCDTCSHLTAASIRGTIATQIWSPTSREGDFGLGHRSLPASMSRLGTPTVISLG